MRSIQFVLSSALLPIALLLVSSPPAAAAGARPGRYLLDAKTEDALRYADTREEICLRGDSATALFPILRHQAFAGCTLAPSAGDPTRPRLVCDNPQAASGAAQLTIDANRITGVLEIKMGGKNMTLSQRIDARRLGDCTR
jgi:hypothetical protein